MRDEQEVVNSERHILKRFYIFILRAILGAAFAVILTHVFYPQARISYTAGLWGFLVGMAYVFEYFRARK